MKLLKSRKGQSVVETALILPIIVLIFTGIIDFGIMFGNYMLVNSISREAARYASIGYSDSEVRTAVKNMIQVLDESRMHITIYPSDSSRQSGEEVTVIIEYDNEMLTPVIGAIVSNSIKLTSKTTMRVE